MPVVKKSTKAEELVVPVVPVEKTVKAVKAKAEKKTEPAPVVVPVVVAPVVAPVAPKSARSKSSSTKTDKVAPAPVVVEKVVEKKAEPKAKTPRVAKVVDPDAEPKTRRVPTKDTLNENFASLEEKVTKIVDDLRMSGQKNVGIANWKSTLKLIKQLHSDSNRVTKVKKVSSNNNQNGGFHKLVKITPELSTFCATNSKLVATACRVLLDNGTLKSEKFTDWKSDDWTSSEFTTRSKVTKFLCDYVKANKLQKQENKREFIVDSNMKTLFKLNKPEVDNDGKNIDYCSLQKLVKFHYLITPVVA